MMIFKVHVYVSNPPRKYLYKLTTEYSEAEQALLALVRNDNAMGKKMFGDGFCDVDIEEQVLSINEFDVR